MGEKQTNIKITLNEEVFFLFFIKYPILVLLEKNRFQADTWLYMKQQVVHLFQRLCVGFMQNGFSHLSHR